MYVFDEYPIVVSRELAKAIGLNEAIVLQQLHYWVIQNKKNNINFYDGHYWTFNSIRSWIETDFVFFSEKTLRRTFDKLEKMNLLLVGNYNKDPRNQTKWYTINEAALEEYSKEIKRSQEVQNTSIKVGENAFGQNDQMYIDKEYLSKNTIKEYQSINPDWDKDKIIDFF